MTVITFKFNSKPFLRDPQSTQLGQKIIQNSVELIDALGFEHFTFKKLAMKIGSTEPSIYRYFENKHRLLHYLAAWYWSWMDYRLELATASLGSAEEKLRAAIRLIAEEKKFDPTFQYVNEQALHRIVVNELEKTYLTKWVEEDNQLGLFEGFKALTQKIAAFIRTIAPRYQFTNALVSSILLAANQQLFFLQHLPSLSSIDRKLSVPQRHYELNKFIESLVFGAIKEQ